MHIFRLSFKAKSLNGGYLQTNDYDTGTAVDGAKQYYQGTEQVHEASFTWDYVKPYHCSIGVGETCGLNMLDRGPPFTKEVQF